jgi:hypothetical protein
MSPADARLKREEAAVLIQNTDDKRKRKNISAYVLIGLLVLTSIVLIVPRFVISKREREQTQSNLRASQDQAEIQQEITYQARSEAALERETREAEAGDLA